jgi:hypothetical protein
MRLVAVVAGAAAGLVAGLVVAALIPPIRIVLGGL